MLAEKESPVKKKVVEVLGSYNPRKKSFQVKEDRMKYWIAQRVELSETMHNLLVDKKFVDGKKVKAFNIPKKPADIAPTTPSADAATPPLKGGETAYVETPAEVTSEAPTEVKAETPAEAIPEKAE